MGGMVWSILAIRFLRFIVWAHHMFVVGMDTDSKAYFSAATVVIGIPTGVKVFAWIAHYNMATLDMTIEVFWAYLFIWLFVVGGLTGIVLSSASRPTVARYVLRSGSLPLCTVYGCCSFLSD